jgi:dTDP-4-amino-4,6-dideoxygalactose transaminase
MTNPSILSELISRTLGERCYVLTGRGTTALWLALRAVARRDGPGEVIIPDMLCAVALQGVLLAGFTPVFADVEPDRFTLTADSVRQLVTPRTRAVLVAHLFGHVADIDAIRAAAPGLPIIEDAVQGFGGHFHGKPVGSVGDLSFVSFDSTKMIGGRGGALLFGDPSWRDSIEAGLRLLDNPPEPPAAPLDHLLSAHAAAAYREQLRVTAPALLRPFDASPGNVERIAADWQTLPARVAERNAKARILQERLSGLDLPEIRDGDAIWRYTFAEPSVAHARWIMHGLQRAGLNGSGLYYPLSRLFGQQTVTGTLANRMVNLWVDAATSVDDLYRAADIISSLPK